MLRIIIPIIFLAAGLGVGIAAGVFLPPQDPQTHEGADQDPAPALDHKETPKTELEFFELSDQFVVPIVQQNRIARMVVISLALEVSVGHTSKVFDYQPKIRSAFLQVLFDHGNMGGFEQDFTNSAALDDLRALLLAVAHKVYGPDIHDVLITNITRQDY